MSADVECIGGAQAGGCRSRAHIERSPAGSGLEEQIPSLLEAAGLPVLRETVATRESSGGKFVSVKLTFRAESREQYEVAHAVLREHPEVKWTL